ncbi:MAG: hypothetical protein ACK50G_00885 [bacterium]|jgi:hypothetical protein
MRFCAFHDLLARLAAMLVAFLAATSSLGCEAPRGIEWTPPSAPARAGVLRWAGGQSAVSHSVSLRESIPDGRRLVTRQWIAREPELSYAPAAAPRLTKIVAQVKTHCNDGSTSAPAAFEIAVDRQAWCAAPAQLALEPATDGLRVKWERVPGADGHVVRTFRLVDARPLAALEAAGSAAVVPRPDEPIIVQVHSRCGALLSVPAAAMWINR